MANNVMSLQSKLISRKNKTIIITIIITIIVSVLVTITTLGLSINSCGFSHIEITNELKSYKQNMNPEFCANLLDKIITFNKQCPNPVEILDCG